MKRWPLHIVLILALTLLTQVGGLVYVAALFVIRRVPLREKPWGFAVLFVALYLAAWLPIEGAARLGGRTPLPCFERAHLSASAFSCMSHRHYVKSDLLAVAEALAGAVDERFPDTHTRALDAGFPFFDGVPLPPHLSHDDGEKLDLAFYYTRDGRYQRGALASPLGYWRFEAPCEGEPQPCGAQSQGWRWNMEWFAPFTHRELVLDEERTRFALRWLAREGARQAVGKVFVEPHLAQRLQVSGSVIRFQGCRAARHDDHIHIQLR